VCSKSEGTQSALKPGELVPARVLSSGAMTNRIDRVEAAGLVDRLPDPLPDPDDRRGTLVALTAKGRQVVDAALLAHVANEERLLGALSAAERRQLTNLPRKLLLSEPFATLDHSRPVHRDRRATDQMARARRPRRR
jgi:DNA-binding MarR family transcriptional regulator